MYLLIYCIAVFLHSLNLNKLSHAKVSLSCYWSPPSQSLKVSTKCHGRHHFTLGLTSFLYWIVTFDWIRFVSYIVEIVSKCLFYFSKTTYLLCNLMLYVYRIVYLETTYAHNQELKMAQMPEMKIIYGSSFDIGCVICILHK